MKSLPNYHPFNEYPSMPLRTLFIAASHDALNLLQGLILYNPLERTTAKQALDHEYFTKIPRPTPVSKLPKYVPEGDANKRKLLDFEDAEARKVARKLF